MSLIHKSVANRGWKKVGRNYITNHRILCANARVELPDEQDSTFAEHKVTCYLCIEKMIEQKTKEMSLLKDTLKVIDRRPQNKLLGQIVIEKKIKVPMLAIDPEILERI